MTKLIFPEGNIYPSSITSQENTIYALAKLTETGEKRVLVQGDMKEIDGEMCGDQLICNLTAVNAAALRSRLDWLNPVPLGRQTSFGFGDRLGSATPGHVASLRAADSESRIGPIFAQQSVRENSRTGRTPQEVLDDAMWGVLQEGWREPWGADAALNPPLFREMLDLAHQNFEKDRKTYFVDCQPQKVPTGEQLEDGQLIDLLEQFDSRQLLHVTFGSILDAFGDELDSFLIIHEAAYRAGLEKHFARHLRPFC